MAGETALSANSTTGIYILQDNNGWVAANTPNTCNLGGDSGLVLATSYMYFDDFLGLQEFATTQDTGDYNGWKFYQHASTYLKSNAVCGQGVQRGFIVKVHVTSTQQQNFVKFFDYNQVIGRNEIYLVRQWASTTFKQFSYNATLYKYSPVILTGYDLEEVPSPGKDVQTLTINMRQANRV